MEKIFEKSKNPSLFQKFTIAFKTNAIFGVMHLSPFQGWFNLPIFISSFSIGMAFSLLKEMTGDLWASSSLHIMNNTVATVALRMA
jgi:membrane protease YdiL (CAAX protease family)